MEVKLDFRKYFMEIIKKWWIIAIAGGASLLIGIGINIDLKPDEFSGCATVYSASVGSYTDSLEGIKALQDYSDIVTSYKVSNRAALILGDDSLNGDDINSMISYTLSENATIYYIYASSTDEFEAIRVANAVAEAFVIEIRNITGEENIQILDEARESVLTFNGRSSQIKGILLITLIGVFLTVMVIVAISFFSTKIVTIKECSDNGELKILGVIPDFEI